VVGGRLKIVNYVALPLLLFFGNSSGTSVAQSLPDKDGRTETIERMVVASGNVAMNFSKEFAGIRAIKDAKKETLRFDLNPNSFFVVRVINDVLRGPEPGSMALSWRGPAALPEPLSLSTRQVVIEKTRSDEPFELVVRDGATGFTFFNIEGHLYDYDRVAHSLSIIGGRLLISQELANKLGRPGDVGEAVGEISISATLYPIEVTTVVNGAVRSSILPPRSRNPNDPDVFVPGPDIIVGDMTGLAQFGSASGQVGLGIGTTSCNNGDQEVHFFQLPNPDHSIVTQNLYRMSGGATNSERFEQIGQAWVKHTFGANQDNACSFGCTPAIDDTTLGVGCSDPYAASQNASQTDHVGALGSRAWVNPFTGFFPTNPRPENHAGHTHTGTSHRILVNSTDLNTTMNTGATYYAEVQYDSPHEYAWCQAHAGQCNMYNNASYRRYNVAGTTSFTFAAVGSTVRMTPATGAWTGSTSVPVEPEPGIDGRAFVVYKVTNPSAGVWHYEYAIHNQNLDRSIQSFGVPLGLGAVISNIGFHAPPNHPGFPNDGTVGNTGFSNAVWTSNQTASDVTWNSETFAQNQNANAIRFGTMYNFRFDSDQPPQTTTATVGFLKTGLPITIQVQGPSPATGVTPTPTPVPTASPTATPATSVNILGAVVYCPDPFLGPVSGVTLTLTGSASGSVLSDGTGNYQFLSLPLGGNYTVTPSKNPLVAGATGINTVDVLATQRHFLNITSLPPGCRLTAADVNGDTLISTVDVIAIQRFFLGLTTGTANVGKYQFNPLNRTYSGITSDQTGQNYDTLVYGDVSTPFAAP
jgi:hypothetical protein